MKTWKVIKTEEEYDRANERVEFLMEIEPLNNTPEGD
jgi:antitoxin component HigA of HigAB toxin-antitoxin module